MYTCSKTKAFDFSLLLRNLERNWGRDWERFERQEVWNFFLKVGGMTVFLSRGNNFPVSPSRGSHSFMILINFQLLVLLIWVMNSSFVLKFLFHLKIDDSNFQVFLADIYTEDLNFSNHFTLIFRSRSLIHREVPLFQPPVIR